jgi:glycosyltransferase involved in cell wall biosynthesis
MLDALGARVQVVGLTRSLRCDVVHANTLRAGVMSAALTRCPQAKLVVHVRDSLPPGRAPRALLGYLGRRAAAFVPTSRYLAGGLPRGPIVAAVANAVEPDRFDPELIARREARRRLGLGADEPVLAVVGQISPHKGQAEAIEILRHVRHEHPMARLLIVGSAKFTSAATRYDNRAYEAHLLELAHRHDLRSAVRFLGERQDVPALLRAVDIQLVPSWYEPFGRVALEGMIMGLPVLATTVGGTKEVVRDGQDGLLLEPRQPAAWAKAVCELLADPHRRSAMGACGRARALSRFGPAAHARAIVSTYERVLASDS